MATIVSGIRRGLRAAYLVAAVPAVLTGVVVTAALSDLWDAWCLLWWTPRGLLAGGPAEKSCHTPSDLGSSRSWPGGARCSRLPAAAG